MITIKSDAEFDPQSEVKHFLKQMNGVVDSLKTLAQIQALAGTLSMQSLANETFNQAAMLENTIMGWEMMK